MPSNKLEIIVTLVFKMLQYKQFNDHYCILLNILQIFN